MNRNKIVKNFSLVVLGLIMSVGIIYGTNLFLKGAEISTRPNVSIVLEMCSTVNYSFCENYVK